jgi:hypothetical protein
MARRECRYCPTVPHYRAWRNGACRVCWQALRHHRVSMVERMHERAGAASTPPGQEERVARYAAIVAAGGRLFE